MINKADSLPTADETTNGTVYMYSGETDATYTHGYIYECQATNTYADTTTFEPATISGTVVTATSNALSSVLVEYLHADPTTVVSGTLTYDQSGNLWICYCYDADSTEVGHFQLYQEDWEDAGFTFTGTPADGDVVAFATTVTIASTSYAWVQIDVQPTPVIPDPLPSQTGNAGKFLTTDGTDASWSDKPLVNNATGTDSYVLGGTSNASYAVCITPQSGGVGNFSVAIGRGASASFNGSIAIGAQSYIGAANAIQLSSRGIGDAINSDANTMKVANNNGNFEIMSADGTIPTDRFTTSPVADGSYVPTLTISSGTATRTWAAAASAPVVPSTMPELTVADWSSNTQTVNVTGVTANNIVFVSPAPASAADYADAGIVCTAQGSGTLTFTCTTVPSNNITVNVVILG